MAANFQGNYNTRKHTHPNDNLSVRILPIENTESFLNGEEQPPLFTVEKLPAVYLHVNSGERVSGETDFSFNAAIQPRYRVRSLQLLELSCPKPPNITHLNNNGELLFSLIFTTKTIQSLSSIVFTLPVGIYSPQGFAAMFTETINTAIVKQINFDYPPLTATHIPITPVFLCEYNQEQGRLSCSFDYPDNPVGERGFWYFQASNHIGSFFRNSANFAQFSYRDISNGTSVLFNGDTEYTRYGPTKLVSTRGAFMFTKSIFVNSIQLNNFTVTDTTTSSTSLTGELECVGSVLLSQDTYTKNSATPYISKHSVNSIQINLSNPSKMINDVIDFYLTDDQGNILSELYPPSPSSQSGTVDLLFKIDMTI
jgi:hypothetical protein